MNISFAARLLAVLLSACATAAASEVWDLGVHGYPSIGATGAVVVWNPPGNEYTNAAGAQIGPFTRVIGPGDSLPGTLGSASDLDDALLLPNTSVITRACCSGLISISPSGGVQLLVDGLTPRPGTTGTFLGPSAATASFPFAAFCAAVWSSTGPVGGTTGPLGDGLYTIDLRQTGDRPQVTETVYFDETGPAPYDSCSYVSVNSAGTVAYLHDIVVHSANGSIQQYWQIETAPIGGPSLAVVTQGDPAPNGRAFGPVYFPRLNPAGTLAFGAYLFGPTSGYGIFLWNSGSNFIEVIDPQQGVPGRPGYAFESITDMRLLPDGTVIFAATYDPVNQVNGLYRVRPPYSSIEVIFDAADPVLINGQLTSLFANPNSYPLQSCTWAQAQTDPTCSYMGSVFFGGTGQFANDSGSVAFSIDTPQPQPSGPSVFASFVNAAATSSGSGVSVNEAVTLPNGTLSATAQIAFNSVQASGITTVTATTAPSGGATQPPTGFQFGTPAVSYDVSTTATFTGPIQLCFTWQEGQFVNDNNVQLFHYENGAWQNVTTSLNAATQTVCGQVTSLSPFGVVEKSYGFSGFFPPVDNPPSQNAAKAGSAIPVMFSLNGNQGLSVFYTGYPVSQPIACATGVPTATISETLTANASGLQYNPQSDQYTYAWKTDKSWANSCRRLFVKFNDGSQQHTADFIFH